MRIAVSGASGHIGNNIVQELIKNGANLRILVHNFENDLIRPNVEVIRGDILNPESVNRLCKGADVVFHLAAQIAIDNRNSKDVFATNVTGTKNIINASQNAGIKRFIHFSSIHAFQAKPIDQILDEKRALVDSEKAIYEFTKAESEKLVLQAVRQGLNAVILSPTAVIGPFDYRGSYLGKALRQMYKNKMPALVFGAYNWVDVRDVVSAAIRAIEKGNSGEKYILAGHYCSLIELSRMVSAISGNKTPDFVVPVWLARLATPFIQLYSSITKNEPFYTNQSLNILGNSPRYISFKKAQKELGYNPRKLEETLKDTFEWYHKNNYLN